MSVFKHGNGNEYQYKVTGNNSQNACFSDDIITKELDKIGLLKDPENYQEQDSEKEHQNKRDDWPLD